MRTLELRSHERGILDGTHTVLIRHTTWQPTGIFANSYKSIDMERHPFHPDAFVGTPVDGQMPPTADMAWVAYDWYDNGIGVNEITEPPDVPMPKEVVRCGDKQIRGVKLQMLRVSGVGGVSDKEFALAGYTLYDGATGMEIDVNAEPEKPRKRYVFDYPNDDDWVLVAHVQVVP